MSSILKWKKQAIEAIRIPPVLAGEEEGGLSSIVIAAVKENAKNGTDNEHEQHCGGSELNPPASAATRKRGNADSGARGMAGH